MGTINIAVCGLLWCYEDQDFVTWLREVKAAGYEGIAGFANGSIGDLAPFVDTPASLEWILTSAGESVISWPLWGARI